MYLFQRVAQAVTCSNLGFVRMFLYHMQRLLSLCYCAWKQSKFDYQMFWKAFCKNMCSWLEIFISNED